MTPCLTAPAQTAPKPSTLARQLVAWPFDLVRYQYAWAVWAGLVPRSALQAARLEKALDDLEKRTLGPLARRR